MPKSSFRGRGADGKRYFEYDPGSLGEDPVDRSPYEASDGHLPLHPAAVTRAPVGWLPGGDRR
ncbi:hypothetical protein [Streptomyces sp. KHY 26]|uniref:hypothetical protein n=1 Tax=Streptomyces sp. KHY 26 TaxID=3097359 RepID=UPI00376EE9A9